MAHKSTEQSVSISILTMEIETILNTLFIQVDGKINSSTEVADIVQLGSWSHDICIHDLLIFFKQGGRFIYYRSLLQ